MEKKVLDSYKKAGEIAKQVMPYAKSLCKEGVLLLDIAEKVENEIKELKGEIAFPINLSLNALAAHYTPTVQDKTKLAKGDLLKIDIGVHVDGYIADMACSVSIGDNKENEALIKAANECVEAGVKLVKADVDVSTIGKAVESAAKSYDFKPIYNLTGHGLDQYTVHGYPSIPNFEAGKGTKLEKNTAVAIEPFVTSGSGKIQDSGEAEIFQLVNPEVPLRMGREILLHIAEEYGNLPFAKRWLVKQFGAMKVNLVLRTLLAANAMEKYPPLKEVSNGKIAQAEHTCLILEKETIIITK